MSSFDPTDGDFRDLFEHAPCGYLSLGTDGKIVRVNATLCGWLGQTPDDLIGRRLRDLLNIAGSIFYETHFAPLLRMQGHFEEVALDLVLPSGGTMPVLANAAERRLSDDMIVTRVTLFRAPQRRRYERELVDARAAERDARRKLEDAVTGLETRITDADAFRSMAAKDAELREMFIAVLGHDLRNPLAGLAGGTNILSQMHHDTKSVRVVGLMKESISRMSGLIENLMDFARGRLGGGIGVQKSTGLQVEPTLVQVVDEMRVGHPDRTIDMRFDITQPIDIDHARLAQMFSNLLGNAITHGAHDRSIVVEAGIADNCFILSIVNGGEPIPQAALDRLFQPFYRGEVRPSMQGLGLGLYIASQIAQAHGGRIDVTSDTSETRFTFKMPLD